jgi:hypothetical protein
MKGVNHVGSDGTKLAIAILMLFLAGVGFFIAFHPNGLDLQSDNAPGILQWFMAEFEGAATGTPVSNTPDPAATSPANSALPTGNAGTTLNPSTNITNLPNSSALPPFPNPSTNITNV